MMKKRLLLIPLCLLSTSSVARVTMEDVNRDMAWFAAQNPTVPQSVIDKQWNDYNQPPEEDANNSNRKWYSQAFVQGRSYTNNYSHEIVVNARGGSRSNGNPYDNQNNRCQLSIIVDGHIVASSANNNNQFAKECFVTASVPVNSRYQITSNPWQSSGSYSTSVNILR